MSKLRARHGDATKQALRTPSGCRGAGFAGPQACPLGGSAQLFGGDLYFTSVQAPSLTVMSSRPRSSKPLWSAADML